MNTMSEPLSSDLMRSESSIAAARPLSGSEPEPSPRVMSAPIWSLMWASDCASDCESVLSAMNSTPADLGLDHAVDGVDAGAADADDAQLGLAVAHGRGRAPLVLVGRRGRRSRPAGP